MKEIFSYEVMVEDETKDKQIQTSKTKKFFVRRPFISRFKKRGIPHRIGNKNIEIRVEIDPSELKQLMYEKPIPHQT